MSKPYVIFPEHEPHRKREARTWLGAEAIAFWMGLKQWKHVLTPSKIQRICVGRRG